MMKARLYALALSLALLVGAGAGGKLLAEEEIILGGTRIVGGESTTIDKHPWQVAITVTRPRGTYLCGGSLIARKWVLSAAHCFQASDQPNAVRVKAGATDYRNQSQGVAAQVEKVVIHDKYGSTNHDNDLALVKLKTAPALGRDIKVVPLMEAAETISLSEPLEVTG